MEGEEYMQKIVETTVGVPYPLGVSYQNQTLNFAYISEHDNCGIILYDKVTKNQIGKYHFKKQSRIGNVVSVAFKDVPVLKLCYQIFDDEEIVEDSYAKSICGRIEFGKKLSPENVYYQLPADSFDWEDTKEPKIPYEESFIYCLHVRGFTKHPSSKVKSKGTFSGVIEKIPYLKDLGVTTVELMPVYHFPETIIQDSLAGKKEVVNYWGFTKAAYYMPKSSYGSSDDCVTEFKELVKQFHKNDMEVILQFYFPKEFSRYEIIDVLRFWKREYHVDGFHLKGEDIPLYEIATEPILSDSKIMDYYFPEEKIYARSKKTKYRNLANYNDEFMYTLRKFLKGDEDMVAAVQNQMRRNPKEFGKINYITNYYGFTLKDLVSYERKHNELNGEENKDGNDANFSWNCGVEGVSRKKNIMKLRLKQMKNALCFLLLSQGTPLIFMGDEFGNSQNGNNNPYCQDNEISWLNWKNAEANCEIGDFLKQLISFRKEHGVFRQKNECRFMDYMSCGYPDLSYHGNEAWKNDVSRCNRQFGMMYAGDYAKKLSGDKDDYFYVAINMHWEPHKFALPKLPKGMEWQCYMVTDCDDDKSFDITNDLMEVKPRSIRVMIGK